MKLLISAFLVVIATPAWCGDLTLLYRGSPVARANPLRRHMALLDSEKGTCSGVLIGANHVLTAAHCLAYGLTTVIFYADTNSIAAKRSVAGGTAHPSYRQGRANGQDYDLALVEFSGGMPAGFAPAPLFSGTVGAGDSLTVAGFGLTNETDPSGYSPGLFTSELRLDKIGFGKFAYWEASGEGEMLGACPGDSGGGGFVKSGGVFALAGLITRKLGSDRCSDSPGTILIALPDFTGWIRAHAGE